MWPKSWGRPRMSTIVLTIVFIGLVVLYAWPGFVPD